MKKSREQLKAELMAKMEEVVEQMLEWREQGQGYTFREIEDEVMSLGKNIQQTLTEAAIEQEETRQPAEPPGCPRCGEKLVDKGLRTRQVRGRGGKVMVERGYYICPKCGQGFFPSGRSSEIDGSAVE